MPNYTKLFNSIVTSTIWTEDDKTRILWITMLAMADQHGEVHASIPGLARIAGMTTHEAEAAIGKFLSPDPYSRTPDNEGRRVAVIDGGWELLNHAKYRKMASKEDSKAATAERVRRHRDRNANVTPRNGDVTDKRDIAEAEADTKAEANNTPISPKGEEDEIFIKWNSLPDLPKIVRIGAKRKTHAKSRLKDSFFRDNWRQGMEAILTRPFLLGMNDRGWKADIDWFLQPDSLTKIMEGKYTAPNQNNAHAPNRAEPGSYFPGYNPNK